MKVWILVILSLSACQISSTTEFGIAPSRSLQDQPDHLVILYDESRSIWVMLTNDQILCSFQGGDPNGGYWSLIVENLGGHWASDNELVTTTGNFKQNYGVVWFERQGGGSSINHFVRIDQGDSSDDSASSAGIVVLYDKSRSAWIMLTDKQVYLNYQGGDPQADYWYLIAIGYWTVDSQFITQTGYFRQKNGGDDWINQQGAKSYDFVMQKTNTQV